MTVESLEVTFAAVDHIFPSGTCNGRAAIKMTWLCTLLLASYFHQPSRPRLQ